MHLTDPKIESYCEKVSDQPSATCNELFAYTEKNEELPIMMVGGLEGAFLGFLVSALGAKQVLEIGTFTGYSAMAMAERLPADGSVHTCDINEKTMDVARRFWAKSPAGKKITGYVGPALETLKKFKSERREFDLIFIDADKPNYGNYFEVVLGLLSSRGVIVADNCLYSGQILNPETAEENGKAIHAFNQAIGKRTDLEKVLLTVRDGVFLIRPKKK